MRIVKIIVGFLMLFSLGCNRPAETLDNKGREDSLKKTLYKFFTPAKVSSLYNESKFNFYALQCDDTVSFINKKDTIVTYGMLDLNLVAYYWRHDTLELYYCYYYNDSLLHYTRSVDNFFIAALVYTKPYEHPFEAITAHENFFSYIYKSPDRISNPLQSSVVIYINRNRKKINPWLQNWAKQMEILE